MKQNYLRASYLWFTLFVLQFAVQNPLRAQCSPNTPTFTVDLTGKANGTWISPLVKRVDTCCGATGSDKCIEFVITLDTGSTGFVLDFYSGAVPSGALTYSINCMGTYAVGAPICLNGKGPHYVRFCKPGNNQNEYIIRALPKPAISPRVIASQTCTQQLFLLGLIKDSITWSSWPSNPTYDSYLSCTKGCDTVSVKPTGSFPKSVLYRGCGTAIGGCATNKFCDTVRVTFVNSLGVTIAPKNKYICFGDTSAILTATPSGGLSPYKYLWSNGKTTSSIQVGAGTYTVTLTDSMNCNTVIDTAIVNAYTMAIKAIPGNDTALCSDIAALVLNGTIQSAGGGKWSGAGVFSPSDSTMTPKYTFTAAEKAAGFGTVTLRTTHNNGCPPDTAKMVISFNPTPAPVISGPGSTCSNRAYTYSVTAISGSSYSWSVAGGIIQGSTTSNTVSVLWGAAGTGTITVTQTSNFGCDSTVSRSITINPTPAPVISGPAGTCSNRGYTYSISTIAGSTYNWTVTGGTIQGSSTSNSINVLWGAAGSGTVTVKQTSSFGCDSTISRTITINPTPAPVITGPDSTCSNRSYTYSINTIAGSTYSWTVTGGTIQGSNTNNSINVLWGAAGTGVVTVKQTSSFGCDSTISANVTIMPTPAPVISGPAGTCSNRSYTYSIATIAGSTYSWSVTGGVIQGSKTSNSINVLWGSAGSGTVTVKQTSSFGCDSTISRTITINPTPAPVISGPAGTCSNRSYTYSITTIAGSTYNWTVTGGAIQGSNTNNSINVLWGAAGTGTVTVKQTSSFGCDSTISRNITINPTPAPVITGPGGTCSNRSYTYSISTIAGSTYNWSVTGGSIQGSNTSNSINVLWGAAGIGTVTVKQTSSFGCDSTISANVTINPTPAPVISGPAGTCSNRSYTYSISAIAGSTYNWTVSGGSIQGSNTSNSINVLWGTAGTGTVTVKQTSSFGCDSVISRNITINPTPAPVISGPDSTCSNKIYTYSINTISGSTYNWSVTGGTIIGTNTNNSISVQWGVAGTGTVSVRQTSSFGCDSAVSATVIIMPTPAPVISGPDSTCSNRSYTYSISSIPGSTYSWTISGGTIMGSTSTNSISVLWGASGAGSLKVTQVSDRGCDSTIIKNITIVPTPAPVVSGPDSTCSNRIYTYSISPIAGSSYQWIISRGTIQGSSNTNSVRILWGSAGVGLVSVIQTSAFGCDSLASKDIVIMPTPNPSISGPDSTCSNRVYTYSVYQVSGSTYSWQVNGGIIEGSPYGNSVSVIWGAPGTGTISISQTSDFGCDSTIVKNIHILPTPDPKISGAGSACSNRSYLYSVAAVGGSRYLWSVQGGIIQGSKTNNTINVLWGPEGAGKVTVTQTSGFGCDSTISKDINILPTPDPRLNGPDSFCSNRLATYFVTFIAGHTYNWTATGGVIVGTKTSNKVDVLWGAPGIGTLSIYQQSAEGCDSTLVSKITIMPTPAPVITGNDRPCQNKVYTYSVPLLLGHSYQWTVNGGVISGPQNSNVVKVTWGLTGTGTINLHQVSPFGCDSLISKDVTILPTPAPVIFGLGNTCENKTYKYSVSAISGHTYNWLVIGGTILGPNNGSSVTVRWGKPGTGMIRLNQISNFGCDSAVSRNILITPTPAPVILGPGISCQNYVVTYVSPATSGLGLGHYWQVSGGRIIGFMNRDTVKVAWDSSGMQWIQLTLVSPLGCDSTVRRTIEINPNPILNIDGPEIVCENHTSIFQTDLLPDMSYIWTMNGGGRFTGNTSPANTAVFWTTAGKYELSLKYRNANGCEGIAKKPVVVVDFPKPLINGPQFGCANTKGNFYEGNTYTLLNKKGNTLKYYWSTSPPTPFSLLNETTIAVDWGAPGTYAIILRQVNTITGCDDTSRFFVEVDSIKKPMINGGDIAACAPFTVDLMETSGSTGLSYTWYLESGMVKGKQIITNTFTKIGGNPVKLVVSNKYGCQDSIIIDVRLFPKPKADFLVQSPAPYYSDDTLAFKNTSTGALYYTWDFGDGDIAYTKDARHRFMTAAEHTVWLYAESEQGCRDSISKKLRIMLKPQIFIPNAFTPGSIDDINPTFRVSTRNISRFTILIYNRWGQIIYRADQPDFEWDGTYQGLPVMDGVYPYLIQANGYQGERFTLSGEINVIR